MYDLSVIFKTILKQGLREDTINKRGITFLVRHKEHFMNGKVKGFISGSLNSIQHNINSCTHWSPNLFANGTYTDSTRKYIKGYYEENLRQINTFVVEIDTKEHSIGEIILECVDTGLGEPTLILESDRGYHVYFVLDKPTYVTAQSNYKSLKVAKRISLNMKRALSSISVDMECNDFTFFRMPNSSNVVWFNESNTKSFSMLMNWSMQYDDSIGRTFKVLQGGKSNGNSTDWIRGLIGNNLIKGTKGKLGRNNILFTLALSCFEEGKDLSICYDILDEFNSTLQSPISNKAIKSIIKSAYSGKYNGASEDYISDFYDNYSTKTYTKSNTSRHWYKHKKARVDRTRSHYNEWEVDINKYINANVGNKRHIELSQSELCSVIGISRSTLNEIMKNSRILIKSVNGKGRNATTKWTTISTLYNYAITKVRSIRIGYTKFIESFVTDVVNDYQLSPALKFVINLVNGLDLSESSRLDSLII